MRIAVLIYPTNNAERLTAFAKGLVEGLQNQGHTVDIFNARNEGNIRLGMYDYLCIGTQANSFLSGKIDPRFAKQLDGMLGCSGKRCCAFVDKQAFFSESVLKGLMRAMEAQGMFLRNSAIFSSIDEAMAFGTTLEVARKV